MGKFANDATVESAGLNGFIFKDTYDSETDNRNQNSALSENILTSSSPVIRAQSSLQGWVVLKDSYCTLNKRGYRLDRIEFTIRDPLQEKEIDEELIYRVTQ